MVSDPSPPDAEVDKSRAARESGSAMPLVIGMTLCLLLLSAGVAAATSAFTARSSAQHQCDGAAAAAAAAARGAGPHTAPTERLPLAHAAAIEYLAERSTNIDAQTVITDEGVALLCTSAAPILFGALVGKATLEISVRAHAVPALPS